MTIPAPRPPTRLDEWLEQLAQTWETRAKQARGNRNVRVASALTTCVYELRAALQDAEAAHGKV